MLLYHPSDKKFDTIKIKYFGENNYTLSDKKSCSIERSFFYLTPKIPEHRFKNSKYLYVIKINDKKIYDLRIDKNNLIQKHKTITNLMEHLKKYYIGAVYNVGYDIACIFKDIKPINIIKRR